MRLRTDDSNSLAVDGFQSTTRGSTVPGHDTEMQLIRSFIEKPISAGSFEEAEKVKEALQGRVISVGYMLRYLRGTSGSSRSHNTCKLAPGC
jgi:hypothetical protein